MTIREARLVQYRVLADHRLHFGRLYFQVIGINLTLSVGAAAAIAIGRPAWWDAARLLIGLALLGTAFVAHRLRCQEEAYASALRATEMEEGLASFPGPRGLHARGLVVVALVASGLLLAIEGAYRLI